MTTLIIGRWQIILKHRKEPLKAMQLLIPIIAVAAAFLFGALIFMAAGISPSVTYQAVVLGAFGSTFNLSETFVRMTPLLLTGLSVAWAFRARFFNIGAEGQLILGGIAASGVALLLPERLPNMPAVPLLGLMTLAGVIAGGLWASIPAFLKAYFKVNEVIVTLMLNYIAILLLKYLYDGPWKDPFGWGFPGSALFPENAWLPQLFGTRMHITLFFGLIAAGLLFWVLRNTKWGYEIKVIGYGDRASRYAGINIKRNILFAIMLSGALAGLAGVGEVAGLHHRLFEGLIAGYGFTATTIAWLARLNPIGVIPVSLLMAALFVGGDQLKLTMGLPVGTVLVFQGACLFFVLAGDLFTRYSIVVHPSEVSP